MNDDYLSKRFLYYVRLAKLILFGSYLENPETARDLDLAVDGVQGWKLYELAARIERALRVPLDLVPLDKETPLTRRIKTHGEVLYEQ
ncbi:MAG: DNA polymerase III subunit beta [Bacteroidetes bacterium]|nr:DNA polymerase III subunit beta [Bacteroidota bacterium]